MSPRKHRIDEQEELIFFAAISPHTRAVTDRKFSNGIQARELLTKKLRPLTRSTFMATRAKPSNSGQALQLKALREGAITAEPVTGQREPWPSASPAGHNLPHTLVNEYEVNLKTMRERETDQ